MQLFFAQSKGSGIEQNVISPQELDESTRSVVDFFDAYMNATLDEPDKVQVVIERMSSQCNILVKFTPDPETGTCEAGKMIGRNGRICRSLRVLLEVIGGKQDMNYRLIVQDGRNKDR